MLKMLALNGSPRERNSNTDRLLLKFFWITQTPVGR